MPVISIDPAKKAAIDTAAAYAAVEEWFQEEVRQGFKTNDGWRLGLTPEDVTLLTGNFVLAKEADALGAPIPPVIDMDGVPHEMDGIEELTAIMLGYGQARAALSAEYAARKAAIGS